MIVNPLFFSFVAKKAENHLFFNAVDFLSSFHFCPVHFPGVYEKGDQDCSSAIAKEMVIFVLSMEIGGLK